VTDDDRRPDPDALLARVHAEEASARRGKLTIFFGFAPGVGKTYRMLQVARDLVMDHGVDVVVGVAETHRRRETASMLLGLDLLPRRRIEYRGHTLEEFDLDAALARKPGLILVDELAHTNAPGSRHAKRWQDVQELIDAGIDVFTTVNVQHVESLNDVVAQITRVQVRETVPDAMLDAADAVELVDIAPEALLARLREGKVYLPDQAGRAVEHFFQTGNLLALRELALRRTAQHVDDDVRAYRSAHGVTTTWPAGERILVCVGPAPASARLIRATARMAAGLRCPWVAAYVESAVQGPLSKADADRLEVHLAVAESLGAEVARLSGVKVADALLTYARKQNVTRIVAGKPTHSRVLDRLRGSLIDDLVRGSRDIDVHVIGGDEARDPVAPRGDPPPPEPLIGYAAALGLVGLTLVAALGLRAAFALPDPEMLFLLTVMVTAIRFGRGPSILSAALGVAVYDFFFVPPYLTFSVADSRYFLTFGMMFGVGWVISELIGRLRHRERSAVAREERTAALYTLTKRLAAVDGPSEIAALTTEKATTLFRAQVHVLLAGDDGRLVMPSGPPGAERLDPKDQVVASWAFEYGEPAGLGTGNLPASPSVCLPLGVGGARLGVFVLRAQDGRALGGEQRAFLEVYVRQVTGALERTRLKNDARAAAMRVKTEETRSALLSAVSHDLRTPLASMTGAATALRDDPGLGDETRAELLASICDEAERMERLVTNLLDMTQLESGARPPRREWVPLDEVVGSALTRLEKRLGDRPVRIDLPASLPLVLVDPVLLGQLFVNLLENAEKYTPRGSPIDVTALRDGDAVTVEVSDRGPGVPVGAEERIFDKFHRGAHAGVEGVGLGLPICRAIADAHGGTLRVLHRDGGGATFALRLPIGGVPPPMPQEG